MLLVTAWEQFCLMQSKQPRTMFGLGGRLLPLQTKTKQHQL